MVVVVVVIVVVCCFVLLLAAVVRGWVGVLRITLSYYIQEGREVGTDIS